MGALGEVNDRLIRESDFQANEILFSLLTGRCGIDPPHANRPIHAPGMALELAEDLAHDRWGEAGGSGERSSHFHPG